MSFSSAVPTTTKIASSAAKYDSEYQMPTRVISAAMTAIWAEHGTAMAISAVAMNRSRLLPRMRVVSVPIVTHPRPRMSGITARPLRPIEVRARSARAAILGR